jgi:SAM-dependent methyltransferase
MTIKLEQVVPWGRSMWEYIHMFDLREIELAKRTRILGVGDGPASFNAEMRALGRRVVSCDPIYLFTAQQIRSRVEATHDRMVEFARQHHETFTWRHLTSPEHMGEVRLKVMNRFLADYSAGVRDGRYVAAGLPGLPFADAAFDLALCSHLLFLYAEQLSLDFHLQSVIEMARVAREVRIFPLMMLGNTPSPHVGPVREELSRRGYEHEVRRVPYEFQKGGDEMLVVRRRETVRDVTFGNA